MIECIADWAAILTAALALCFGIGFQIERYLRRSRLEAFLKAEKAATPDKPKRTTIQLMAKVGLTQDEILQASFCSRHIKRFVHVNKDTGLSDELLFEYQE